MPHLIVEYSSNLTAKVNPPAFLERLHEVAVGTGEFPPMSLRTRASERTCFRVGDGQPENGFIHIVLRIRPGRDPVVKRGLGETVFNAACEYLEPVFKSTPLGLTCEVHDIEVDFRFLKNTMVEYWQARQAGQSNPAKGS